MLVKWRPNDGPYMVVQIAVHIVVQMSQRSIDTENAFHVITRKIHMEEEHSMEKLSVNKKMAIIEYYIRA